MLVTLPVSAGGHCFAAPMVVRGKDSRTVVQGGRAALVGMVGCHKGTLVALTFGPALAPPSLIRRCRPAAVPIGVTPCQSFHPLPLEGKPLPLPKVLRTAGPLGRRRGPDGKNGFGGRSGRTEHVPVLRLTPPWSTSSRLSNYEDLVDTAWSHHRRVGGPAVGSAGRGFGTNRDARTGRQLDTITSWCHARVPVEPRSGRLCGLPRRAGRPVRRPKPAPPSLGYQPAAVLDCS